MLVANDAGVVKFANNSFAAFTLASDTNNTVFYPMKTFPGFVAYQFDHTN